jgi:rare lipoprotein A
MLLGNNASLQRFIRVAGKPDSGDVSRLGLRTLALLGVVALTAAALVGCAQSPVRTSSLRQAAPSRQQALLPTIEKTNRGVVATPQFLPHSAAASLAWPPAAEKRHRGGPVTTGAIPRGASVGVASFYTEGVRTANGERLNPNALTAAHPSLPFGTRLRITSVASGRSVIVRVNDRGPFVKGRAVDVSYSAAKELGMTERGVAKVKMEVVETP